MTDQIREAFASILPPKERARRLKGRVLDGYVVGEMLEGGVGGFGVVYRAEHPTMQEAAFKVIAVDIEEDPPSYERFEREVSLLLKMSDAPNVVKIRHAGVVDGMPWFAMEYIKGEPLAKWLQERETQKKPVTEKQLIDILCGVLEGLHQVQSAFKKARRASSEHKPSDCIVHRDIKPGNILVEEHEDGSFDVKLIDFGIAGLFSVEESARSQVTEFTRNAMTLEYASPEMLMKLGHLDVRSDIFQVGLLAFEIMTGRRYWDVWPDGIQELRKAKRWPRWLRKAILRALQWDRDNRYRAALEFEQTLKHARIYALSPRELWRQRLRTVAVVTSLLALVLAGFAWKTYDQLEHTRQSEAILREDGEKLKDSNSVLKTDNETLESKLVNLESMLSQSGEKLDKIRKNDELSKSGSAAERKALLDDIREIYDVLSKNEADRSKLETLQSMCEQFIKSYQDYTFIDKVEELKSWLDGYLQGGLEIIPVRFENHGIRKKTMVYRVKEGNIELFKHEANVEGQLIDHNKHGLHPDGHPDIPTVALDWKRLPTVHIVFEVDNQPETLEVGMHTEIAIHGVDGEEVPLSRDKYRLFLRINRIDGFKGPLPKRP